MTGVEQQPLKWIGRHVRRPTPLVGLVAVALVGSVVAGVWLLGRDPGIRESTARSLPARTLLVQETQRFELSLSPVEPELLEPIPGLPPVAIGHHYVAGIRLLAEMAGLPLGSASRVVSLLVSDALVERSGRGPIEGVDWKGLLQRWSQDYSLLEANRSKFFLEPRGPKALLARLTELEGPYTVTGSLAASRRAEVAPAALAALYVRNIDKAASGLGLRPAPSGGNVVLLEPLADVAFERTWDQDGTTYAALPQVAVDLMTSPGRGPAEAEALIVWMEENEDDWRRPGSGPG